MRVSVLFALSAALAPCITAAPLNAPLNTTTAALSTQGAPDDVFPPELLPLLKAIMEDEEKHPRPEEEEKYFRLKEEEKHLRLEERRKTPPWGHQLRCHYVCWRPRLEGSEKICEICRRRKFYPWPNYWRDDDYWKDD